MKRWWLLLGMCLLTGCATVDEVYVGPSGVTTLNGTVVPVEEISERLTGDSLIIRAYRSTPYGSITAVVKEAAEAGVEDVKVMVDSGDN